MEGARGPGASVELVVLDLTDGLYPRAGGGLDDSHLQQRRVATVEAAAASAVEPLGFRLLSVSVRGGWVGWVVMGVRCWWCCSGLLLTVAPVL